MFRILCTGALALALIGQADAQSQVPKSPSQHGIFDFGSNTPGSEGFLTKQMLDSELGNYVTGADLTTVLAPYLTQSQASATYLPQAGGTITGDITATASGGGGTTRFGPGSFYGLFTAPGSDLKQGSGMAWNTLGGISGSGVFGETDFYNLKGLGTGGFTFCNGATVGLCKANILLSITNAGVVFSRGSSINGNEAVSGSLIVSSLAGTGSAFACLNASGQLYRSATACQ